MNIRRVRVRNFLSLRDFTVDLGPLTIFIGPNGCGKSAIFKALGTLSKLIHRIPVRAKRGEFTLEPFVTLDDLVWHGNSGLPIEFTVWMEQDPDQSPSYFLALGKDIGGWAVIKEVLNLPGGTIDTSDHAFEFESERREPELLRPPYTRTLFSVAYWHRQDAKALRSIAPVLELQSKLGQIWRYRPSAADIGRFATMFEEEPGHVVVKENGTGVGLALQKLLGENRELFQKIEAALVARYPHIQQVGFQTEKFGVRLAFRTTRSEDIVPAPAESDGVLLTTFLLWRLFTAESSLRLCIEEPENGVHPHLLSDRYTLFKDASRGKLGSAPFQCLISTHSADFLSAIPTREELLDTVRVVEFDPERGTVAKPLYGVRDIDALLQRFDGNVSDLWWSGAMGGVPSLS